MARSKSSQRWLREHFNDPYVKKAQAEGLRSRAAYKLEELIERDKLLKPGMVVVDLGAAPGGWSQLVRQDAAGRNGLGWVECALDILDMPSLAGVDFIHGDFREDLSHWRGWRPCWAVRQVDLVLSDMAPNMSGWTRSTSRVRMYLAELAMRFRRQSLRVGGTFLIKLFQGTGFDDYIRDLRKRYTQVKVRKPEASRKPLSRGLCLGDRANWQRSHAVVDGCSRSPNII
jgi:23S rRNA (uridine2552-2'-O)-methyltransferase